MKLFHLPMINTKNRTSCMGKGKGKIGKVMDVDAIKALTISLIKEEKYSRLNKIINKIGSRNPYKGAEYAMWEEQCFVNYPILYLSSIYLYLYAKRQNKSLFLFATRDGCHWYKIFSKMFPNEKVCYFDCSRIMFDRIALYEKKEKGKNSKDAPEGNLTKSNEGEEVASGQGAYIKYVQNIMEKNNATVENSIYVDIHGSGHRMFGFFEKHFGSVPDCFLLTARFPSYDKAAIICQKYYKLGRFLNIAFETGGGPIEMLNYDLIGTLQNYYFSSITEPTLIPIALRDALEYKKELILPYHTAMEKLIEKTRVIREDKLLYSGDDKMTSPKGKITKYKIDELDVIIKKIFEKIGIDRPIISRQFTHLSSHPRTNLMAILTPPILAPVNSDQTIQKNVEKEKEELKELE